MDKYHIERELNILNSKKLCLIANNAEDQLPELDFQIKTLETDLQQLTSAKEKENNDLSFKKKMARDKELAILTHAIREIEASVFEVEFPRLFQKFYTLLQKMSDITFGHENDPGLIVIKREPDRTMKNFRLIFSYSCHNEKSFEIIFKVKSEDLQEFLKSIVVIDVKNNEYQSNFGHGGTVPSKYKAEEIIRDIFNCFQKSVLDVGKV